MLATDRSAPLLGAALLLWGWQSQQLFLALGLTLLLAAPRGLRWRWQQDDKTINRCVDLCALAFTMLFAYQLFVGPVADAIFTALSWLPVILAPLVLIQYYSDREGLPLTALSLQQRRWGHSQRLIDMGYPYFVVCLLAASMGNRAAGWFYLAMVVLWIWALWRHRNRRFTPAIWLILALIGGGGGYLLHSGLVRLQLSLEQHIPEWVLDWLDADIDPYRRSTAMGSIGRLKASSRIVLRVEGKTNPGLLRTASYNSFSGGAWLAFTGRFQQLQGLPGQIRSPSQVGDQIQILQPLNGGQGMLPLPLGAYRLHGIPSEDMTRNPMGAVKVVNAPDLLRYQVDYDSLVESDSPPTEKDRYISEHYQPTLAAIVEQLPSKPSAEAPSMLQYYFQQQFSYTLDLQAIETDLPPLLDFLNNTRSGHCEYFASASVLLLRQIGIPARYAVGFSVQEYSPLENRYIVRRRHAHAWAIAYIDGRWRNVDTTPAVWVDADAEYASFWAGIYDVLSWLWVRFNEWRMQEEQTDHSGFLLGVLLILVLILVWRLRGQKRIRWSRKKAEIEPVPDRLGGDSECYQLVDWHTTQGLQRPVSEPLASWLQAMNGTDHQSRRELLAEILRLHYRYRFDPVGINPSERHKLGELVSLWFKQENSRG